MSQIVTQEARVPPLDYDDDNYPSWCDAVLDVEKDYS